MQYAIGCMCRLLARATLSQVGWNSQFVKYVYMGFKLLKTSHRKAPVIIDMKDDCQVHIKALCMTLQSTKFVCPYCYTRHRGKETREKTYLSRETIGIIAHVS